MSSVNVVYYVLSHHFVKRFHQVALESKTDWHSCSIYCVLGGRLRNLLCVNFSSRNPHHHPFNNIVSYRYMAQEGKVTCLRPHVYDLVDPGLEPCLFVESILLIINEAVSLPTFMEFLENQER